MKTVIPSTGIAYGLIALGAIIRVVSHVSDFTVLPPNFAPITGIALLGGAYLVGRSAWWVPVGALLLSDVVIGFYHPLVMVAVYGSFLASVVLGRVVRDRVSVVSVTAIALFSSLLFFTVTNFAVWLTGLLYPLTAEGLVAAYVMGLPFFRYTVAGDLFFTAALFIAYALAHHFVVASGREKSRVVG